MIAIIAISVIIIAIVLILSVVTTSKAYTYKHTIDPIDKDINVSNNQSEIEQDPGKES